jgi:hypothetical protein
LERALAPGRPLSITEHSIDAPESPTCRLSPLCRASSLLIHHDELSLCALVHFLSQDRREGSEPRTLCLFQMAEVAIPPQKALSPLVSRVLYFLANAMQGRLLQRSREQSIRSQHCN